jgi:hypothetical protein
MQAFCVPVETILRRAVPVSNSGARTHPSAWSQRLRTQQFDSERAFTVASLSGWVPAISMEPYKVKQIDFRIRLQGNYQELFNSLLRKIPSRLEFAIGRLRVSAGCDSYDACTNSANFLAPVLDQILASHRPQRQRIRSLSGQARAFKPVIRIFWDYYYRSKFHVLSFDLGGDAASTTTVTPAISVI